MNNDSTTMAHPSPSQEADTALHAVTDQAKAANLAIVSDLSDGTDASHVAAHIRGMVAVTMGQLSVNASAITRNNAEYWQEWALGLAYGLGQDVAVLPERFSR